MPDPIEPQQLLDQAWAIAFIEDPEGDPMGTDPVTVVQSAAGGVRWPLTPVDYRRAISSAYYGLFHAVTLTAAAVIAQSEGVRHEIVRWFNHRDVQAVAAWVGGSHPPGLAGAIADLQSDARVRSVSDAFQRLYAARRDADYSHDVSFRQSDVREFVTIAQEAVDLVQEPSFATGPAGRLFLGLVALRARGGGG